MDIEVLIPLIFTISFLILDVIVFVKMISLCKNMKNDTCENLGNKLNPNLYANGILSILMTISMILTIILK